VLVIGAQELLLAYDQQLRTDAETPGAIASTRLGPLRLVTFPGGRGFVTYPHLHVIDDETAIRWVRQVLDHYLQDPEITRVEWKTRGHDHVPGLHEALLGNGFEPDEAESIMIGQAQMLAVDVPLPTGVTLRRVDGQHLCLSDHDRLRLVRFESVAQQRLV
jgi:hypothetical protein